jgi:L-2-hydroxyglutarate oxidase LhgO
VGKTKVSADFQYCIIGGGVIGLAIAYQLSQKSQDVLLIERHSLFGSETSSRNSEVIHAGLYYPSNSLKEQLCLRGKALLYQFCQEFHIPYRTTGKLIVAQQANDPGLIRLEQKARSLNIPTERWSYSQLQQQEPNVRAAEALFSPSTGIIDSHSYMQTLMQQAQRQGALIMLNTEFRQAEKHQSSWQIELNTPEGHYHVSTSKLINSAGLQAQQVAAQCGVKSIKIPALHPCRGHYFSYSGASPFKHLIYPLPEQNLAGLGIHATLDLGNQLKFGPDTQYLEPSTPLDYKVDECLKSKFVQAIRQYFPALQEERLHPDYAGIRPKLHQQHETAADFLLHPTADNTALHLFGIESPGLTASLAIAETVSEWATV